MRRGCILKLLVLMFSYTLFIDVSADENKGECFANVLSAKITTVNNQNYLTLSSQAMGLNMPTQTATHNNETEYAYTAPNGSSIKVTVAKDNTCTIIFNAGGIIISHRGVFRKS